MKSKTPNYLSFLYLVVFSLILKGCCKPEPDYTSSTDYDPRIYITSSSISTNSAVLEGRISKKIYYTIQDCGFRWGTLPESIINLSEHVTINFLLDQVYFIDTLTGLNAKTTYYFVGFANYTHPGSTIIRSVNSGHSSFTTIQ